MLLPMTCGIRYDVGNDADGMTRCGHLTLFVVCGVNASSRQSVEIKLCRKVVQMDDSSASKCHSTDARREA